MRTAQSKAERKRVSPDTELRRLLAQGPEVRAATRASMRANRSRDTTPEMVVRRCLHAAGLRYRLHVGALPGRPDVVFPSRRIVVEVRGCFWHGHSCQRGRVFKTRPEFWAAKVELNRSRDARNERALKDLGWKVLVVWECEIKRGAAPALAEQVCMAPKCVKRLRKDCGPIN